MRGATCPSVAPVNAARDRYLASDWPPILNAHLKEMSRRGETDAEIDLLEKRLCAKIAAIWAKPVRTVDDLVVRAAIAVHWNSAPPGEPAYPEHVCNDPERGFDDKALAHVVKGILDLAGLKFGADGRLI